MDQSNVLFCLLRFYRSCLCSQPPPVLLKTSILLMKIVLRVKKKLFERVKLVLRKSPKELPAYFAELASRNVVRTVFKAGKAWIGT